jgi:hypothetical protein
MAKNKNAQPRAEEPSSPEVAETMEFETWFAKREDDIPKHHHREILVADFKSRGLGQCHSMEEWDAALRKYGVNIGE